MPDCVTKLESAERVLRHWSTYRRFQPADTDHGVYGKAREVGKLGVSDDSKAKKEGEEVVLDPRQLAEERRKEKHRKKEEEREQMRQEIRDKYGIRKKVEKEAEKELNDMTGRIGRKKKTAEEIKKEEEQALANQEKEEEEHEQSDLPLDLTFVRNKVAEIQNDVSEKCSCM
ncbi:PREDICTED: complexin-like [Priapulus caudatus]|uniref:Complexin-like n=1 Tax=Priapulus caudatus TaxID=37621 RepID=A0ABM1E5I8_PRICU|nr:PREDICTED: complexin-like [Priapulus caudatus]